MWRAPQCRAPHWRPCLPAFGELEPLARLFGNPLVEASIPGLIWGFAGPPPLMTTIEFLGHSGLAVEHAGRLLLCDPWLSPRGAYNASWFQYPEYPAHRFSKLLRPDA